MILNIQKQINALQMNALQNDSKQNDANKMTLQQDTV